MKNPKKGKKIKPPKFPKEKDKRRNEKNTMKEIKTNPDAYYDWDEENFEKFRR